jgi:outer membrane receptor for ferric coprogen and ferric-rhodotorulic acid
LPGTADQYSQSVSYTTSAYFQEQADVIPKYLTLVGGLGYLSSNTFANSDVNLSPKKVTETKTDPPLLHRYGVVVHLTKEVALYGLYSETAQGSQQVENNEVFPGTVGKGKELGIKTALFNGALSGEVSVYNIQITNQLFYTGIIDPATGNYVYEDIGTTGTRGWSIDAALRLTEKWQLMGHFDHSPVVTLPGDGIVGGSDKGVLSFFTRYDISNAFSVGGGFTRTEDAVVSTGGITFLPGENAPFIDVKAGNEVSLFGEWRYNRHWSVRLGVENLLNSIYPQGINAIVQIDPSPPREENLRVTYKF